MPPSPPPPLPGRETHTRVEPLYNEVLSITNDFLYPSNSKMYGKEPRYKRNLVIAKIFCQSLGPSLYRSYTVDA